MFFAAPASPSPLPAIQKLPRSIHNELLPQRVSVRWAYIGEQGQNLAPPTFELPVGSLRLISPKRFDFQQAEQLFQFRFP